MTITMAIAMRGVVRDVRLVLHPDADGAGEHHRVHDRFEATLFDVLLVSLHPAGHVRDVDDSARGTEKTFKG